MAAMSNRFSVYSSASAVPPSGGASSRSPAQVSTTTLLNALHSSYSSGQPYQIESGTSLVVNTWVTATSQGANGNGGTVDSELARRAWEHARRRAEDGCIVLWWAFPLLTL